jgi:hypothetical protein
MIQAVSRFTGHPKVDVVAFSMGVPLTRKVRLHKIVKYLLGTHNILIFIFCI